MAQSDSEFSDQRVEALLRRSQRRVDNALKQIRRPQAAVGVVNSPLGDLLVALSERGIVLIHYLPGDDDLESTIAKLRLTLDPVEDRRSVKEVGTEIRRYLDGDADALRRNIDLSLAVSPFQKKVLHKLREVPRGAVVSYQALGAAAGAPEGGEGRRQCFAQQSRADLCAMPSGDYFERRHRRLRRRRCAQVATLKERRVCPGQSRRQDFPTAWSGATKAPKFSVEQTAAPPRVWTARRSSFSPILEKRKHAGLRPCKICRPA